MTSSPSNNVWANAIQQRFKQTVVSAKNGGLVEARKRVLAQLPISAQSYTGSPYLDLALFSYDEKWVSVMERPKAGFIFALLARRVSTLLSSTLAAFEGRHHLPFGRAPSAPQKALLKTQTDPFWETEL